MLKQFRFLNIVILLIFFFLSCSGQSPVLTEVWWQLNYEVNEEMEEGYEMLSLFIHGTDEDGEEDLEYIYIINDEYEIYWTISAEEWTSFSEQGVTWVGKNGLKAPGNGSFPKGEYRVLLVDIGGERDEKSFFIKDVMPESEEILKPELTYDNSSFTVRSEYPLFQIWFYNEEGELVDKSRSYASGSYQWNEIIRNIRRRSSSFKLYSEPESGAWGLFSGPYFFND